MSIPVVIDCDPGIDDMYALLFALAPASPLAVQGITVVGTGNNNDLELLARNALLAAHICGSEAPIFKGANTKLAGGDYTGSNALAIHGANGLGDVHVPELVDAAGQIRAQPAAEYLEEAAQQVAGLTVIALGPLTNLALALQRSDAFKHKVKRIVLMGGSAGQPLGNKSPSAEANICNDPEAAKAVFECGVPIEMAGLNLTFQVDMRALSRAMQPLNPAGHFLHRISEHYIAVFDAWGEASPAEDSRCMQEGTRLGCTTRVLC
eukprot:TRINITY_DN18656_c0_g1_i1.p1 TRINITY_DN18656_c0_g1~~TRINITY_DN18656_c0_g1_i1.p1  ORF type:complete len:264 (-),score=72.37 TRINITY_DN18656_c0_g1_i1:370-1161(-)